MPRASGHRLIRIDGDLAADLNQVVTGEAATFDATEVQQPDLTGHTLATVHAAGATTLITSMPIEDVGTSNGWVVIDPFTAECEIRRATAISISTVTLDRALSFNHAAGDRVMFMQGDTWPLSWWGAKGDGVTDDYVALQNAFDEQNRASAFSVWLVGEGKPYYLTSKMLMCGPGHRLRSTRIVAHSTFSPVISWNNAVVMNYQATIGTFTASAATNLITTTATTAIKDMVVFSGATGTLPGGIVAGRRYWVVRRSGSTIAVAERPARDVTVNTGTDTFTHHRSHGLVNGDTVYIDGGTAPGGVTSGTTYYVINKTDTTFQIEATLGSGIAVDVTSAGADLVAYKTSELIDLTSDAAGTIYTSVLGVQRVYWDHVRVEGGNVGRFAFTADAATDKLTTSSAHGMSNDDPVTLQYRSGTFPTGITFGQVYYAKNVTATTLELALTPGGATIDVTASGTTNAGWLVHRDRALNGVILRTQQPAMCSGQLRVEACGGSAFVFSGQQGQFENVEVIDSEVGLRFESAEFFYCDSMNTEGCNRGIYAPARVDSIIYPPERDVDLPGSYWCNIVNLHVEQNHSTQAVIDLLSPVKALQISNAYMTGSVPFLRCNTGGIGLSGYTIRNLTYTGGSGAGNLIEDTDRNFTMVGTTGSTGNVQGDVEEIHAPIQSNGNLPDQSRTVWVGGNGRQMRFGGAARDIALLELQPGTDQLVPIFRSYTQAGRPAFSLGPNGRPEYPAVYDESEVATPGHEYGLVVFAKKVPVNTITFTANNATDLFTSSAPHGHAVGDAIMFSGTNLPTPLVAGTVYYVKTTPTATTFTISATAGGATFDVLTAASGGTIATIPFTASAATDLFTTPVAHGMTALASTKYRVRFHASSGVSLPTGTVSVGGTVYTITDNGTVLVRSAPSTTTLELTGGRLGGGIMNVTADGAGTFELYKEVLYARFPSGQNAAIATEP